MNKEQYQEQRNELIKEVENLIAEGKFEDSQVKMEEVKALDNKFENVQREMANLNALKEQELVSLENKSIKKNELENMKQIETTGVKETVENKVLLENAFAKSVMGQELTSQEMDNVTYAEDNGLMIPTTSMNEIIGLVSEEYPFFGDAHKMNVRGYLTIKRHKAIKSGDAKGYKEKEEVEVEENDFVEVVVKGVEVAKLIEVSFKLESMTVPEFMDYLKKELVERIGAVVGKWVFTGDTTTDKEFEGVVKVLETAGQTVKYPASGDVSYETLTGAMAKLASQFQTGSGIYANNATIWNKLANVQDKNGRPIFIPDATSGGVGRIFGLTVKSDGGAPDGVIVVGKPSAGYVINTNKGLSVDTDKNLKKRTTEFLGHAIMDGKVKDERAFVAIIPEV